MSACGRSTGRAGNDGNEKVGIIDQYRRNTMSRYKRILGPQLLARSWSGQQTEARIGCAILNRMMQLGKPQTVRVEVCA